MAACRLLELSNAKTFIDSVDNIVLDCDGVLWNGSEAIDGVPSAVQKLKSLGKKIFYMTNNSTKTREEYVMKCESLGYSACKEEIIGSAYVTAQYIKNVLKYSGKVFVVGSTGIEGELKAAGLDNYGAGSQPNLSLAEIESYKLDPQIKCVVVGFDKDFTYTKLGIAMKYLSQPGCHFVATNTDSGMPTKGGGMIPGTGTLVKAVEVGACRPSDVTCGKPNAPIFEVIQQVHNLDPERTVMVGDRLNTDTELAHNCGLKSLHVLTGCHSLEDARKYQSSNSVQHQKWVPDYYIPSLADLGNMIDKIM